MEAAPPQPRLGMCTVLLESKRIINAHSRHFLALSVLFLLPPAFTIIVYPTLFNLFSHRLPLLTNIFLSLPLSIHDIPPSLPLYPNVLLFFPLFVLAFSLLATGSVTYSVFHGFYGRPVKLRSSIKSALVSFFPLLATFVFVQFVFSGIILASGGFLFLAIKGIELLGFQVHFSSPYFIGFCVIVSLVLIFVLVYLQLNWALASVVVVVESRWVIDSLKRSNLLIRGMRKVAFCLFLFFGIYTGIMVWASSILTSIIGSGDGWKSWAFVAQIVVNSGVLIQLFLYSMAANTVLYMHCKAVHGELAWEIAEEFAREYVSLPFDDGKVPYVVGVAYT